MENQRFSLDLFKKSIEQMIATSETPRSNYYNHKYTTKTKDYTLEEINRIVNGSSIDAQKKLSRNYFYKNGFYRRIIIYYATLLKYVGLTVPNPTYGHDLSEKRVEKAYHNAVQYVDNMSLPTVFTNCSIRALVDGCYYGIIQSLDGKVFSLMDLPSLYCDTRYKDLEGNDIIEFNVSYFDSIIDENTRRENLKVYPKEIRRAYGQYKKGKLLYPWVTLPTSYTVCFPMFGEQRPPFLNVIPATIQYDEAVDTERERDLEEIRKIIVQKIPHLTDGGLLFEPEEAAEIHKGTVGMMQSNKNVSVLTTYADVDSIVSRTVADTSSNNLEKMIQNIYAEAGASSQLFAATGNLALETSIQNDTAFMMYLAHKYETFMSHLLTRKFGYSNLTFSYKLFPVTHYNENKFIDESYKLAQGGYSVILPAIAQGFSQSEIGNIKDLENNVLDLAEKLVPLSNSYTQSSSGDNSNSDGKVGAPKKDASEVSPKTIQNQQSLDNQGGSN